MVQAGSFAARAMSAAAKNAAGAAAGAERAVEAGGRGGRVPVLLAAVAAVAFGVWALNGMLVRHWHVAFQVPLCSDASLVLMQAVFKSSEWVDGTCRSCQKVPHSF